MSDGGDTTATATTTPDPAQQVSAGDQFLSYVPDGYKDEPWVKDTARSEKPFESLFKQFKDAQTAIGKNAQSVRIPGENATAEEVKAYHKAVGVPDTADGYSYKAPDISQETEVVQNYLKEMQKDDSFMKSMRAEAHKLGISDKQFNGLASAFDGGTIAKVRALAEQAQQQATERSELIKKTYGDKAEYVDRVAKAALDKVLPANIKDSGDPQLIIFELGKFIHEQVYKNDTPAPTGGSGSGAMTEAEAIRKQIDEHRATKEVQDPSNRDHEAALAKLRELYSAWRKALGGTKQ